MKYNNYSNHSTLRVVSFLLNDEYWFNVTQHFTDFNDFRYHYNGELDVVEEEDDTIDFWADELEISEINRALYGED